MLWFVKTCGCFPVDVNLHVGMPVCIECLNVCMHACRHACVCARVYIERHVGVYLRIYSKRHAYMHVSVCVCWGVDESVHFKFVVLFLCLFVCVFVCLFVSVSVPLYVWNICRYSLINRWNVYASMRHASMEPCAYAPMHGCIVVSLLMYHPMCECMCVDTYIF